MLQKIIKDLKNLKEELHQLLPNLLTDDNAVELALEKLERWRERMFKFLKKTVSISEADRFSKAANEFSYSVMESQSSILKRYISLYERYVDVLVEEIDKDPTIVEGTIFLHKDEDMVEFGTDIFIVHGHDDASKQTVARFIEKLGLKAVILHECPNRGSTIIEKLERHSGVGFAIVLLTPDDVGGVDESSLASRARQNVILELGYFLGKLGRDRVCALYSKEVERPSDFDGVLYLSFDNGQGWEIGLARELRAAGIPVDLNKI